ncbi:hypothetical protein PCC8801_1726 [Rippkaea orientalis PCC 8801]|uniref:Uncharacterized protein n=1 Tax=Rippkaea orientalis (strain PCC 8801 / RF-1) TaxID=41431 RepID=B7JWS4_RIPO1|nr:hypothetical protein [Rippkaea orientalis]ACK65773.1 hypothetical protein PCC8801_1726 [Rippkaea orientalis PCC 8801]
MRARYPINPKFHPDNLNKILNSLDKITRLAQHSQQDNFLQILTSLRTTLDAGVIDNLRSKSILFDYRGGIDITRWYVYGVLPWLQIFIWITLLPPLVNLIIYLISLIINVLITKVNTWETFFKQNNFSVFIETNINSFTLWGLIVILILFIFFKINHRDCIILTDTFHANKQDLINARSQLTESADIIRLKELEMEEEKQRIQTRYATLGSTLEGAITNFLVQKIADGSFQNKDLLQIQNLIHNTFEEFDLDHITPQPNRFSQSPTIATEYNDQDDNDHPFT